MTEEDVSIIDRIKSWLNEEEKQYNKVEDNENDFHITLWPSKGLKLEAVVKRDKLTIECSVLFRDRTKMIFSTNQEYLHELDLTLHQQVPNFEFLYEDKKQLVGVRIFRKIWSESLTKTSFFDTISSVEHSIYIVVIKERQLEKINV